jgi:hypothetical protein
MWKNRKFIPKYEGKLPKTIGSSENKKNTGNHSTNWRDK